MQQVTVSAAAAQLETATANLGTVFNKAAVNDLPLNGRNFTQLLTLARVEPEKCRPERDWYQLNLYGNLCVSCGQWAEQPKQLISVGWN